MTLTLFLISHLVFILCCIILPKFFIIKIFQVFKTLLIPVPLPHQLLIVTIYCNIRIIQIMNLNYIVYQYLSTLTSKTLEVTTFFVGLTSCENLSESLPCESPPRLHYESFLELTAP